MNGYVARTGARLRRAVLPASFDPSRFYSDGYLTIDRDKRSVLVRGEPVRLTKTEYDLLMYLFQHAGQVLPHQQILEVVWAGQGHRPIDVVHLYIRRLRQKLGESPHHSRYLLTEYGIGYRFNKQST